MKTTEATLTEAKEAKEAIDALYLTAIDALYLAVGHIHSATLINDIKVLKNTIEKYYVDIAEAPAL